MTTTIQAPLPIANMATEPERDEDAIRARLEYLRTNLSAGFTQMPDAVRCDPSLSRSAKLVYEQLLSYMRQRDFCWPSQQRIADDLGTMSRRTVQRALKELYERGFIEKWRRGLNRTNVYFINPLCFVKSFHQTSGVVLVNVKDVCGMRQNVSSRPDRTTLPVEPEGRSKQPNLKEIQDKDIPSNHSTASSGTAIGNDGRTDVPSKPNPTPKHVDATAAGRAIAAIAQTTGIPAEHLTELGITPKRRPIPDFITNMMTHFCMELGENPKSIKSSITRAAKIYFTACPLFQEFQEDPQGAFLEMIYQAKRAAMSVSNVHHRGGSNGARFNRMPVFFTCLENLFQFSPDEKEYLRSDQPLLL